MDEDLDIKQALTRHVTVQEPPFALTAEALLAAGRRRERWRAGITYGAGSVATVVTITGALTLMGPGGGNTVASTVDDVCGLPLAVGWQPEPSSPPQKTRATPWPTASATMRPTSTSGPWPTASPTAEPTSTSGPWPTTSPTAEPTGTTGPWPTASPTTRPTDPWPTASPGPTGPPRIGATTCFLANEIRSLLPEAKYARSFDMPPLALRQTGGGRYLAEGIIVGKDTSTKILFNISPQLEPPPSESYGWNVRTEGDKVIRSLDSGGLIQVEVYTGRTYVFLTASGPVLTVAQLERLALAPGLELLR